MKKTIQKYYPLIPVFAAYLIMFLIGFTVPGMWQMVALLAFYCALGQSWNIFMGMTGYVDFGYVTFIALGTYGMALGISYFYQVEGLGIGIIFIGIFLALFLASLSALLEAAIALRLRGAYFAIACIGINEGLRYFIEGTKIWGGSEGIIFSGALTQAVGREVANQLTTFWADFAVFIVAALAAFLNVHYMRSKIGYALTAVREDEDAARVMGINTTKYKTIAFLTSGLLGGLVGAMAWGLKLTHVFPGDVFVIHYTVECIVVVLLGGAGTLLGPVVGGLLYGLSKYWLAVILPGFQLLIFAPIIIAVIVAFPGGIIGLVKQRMKGTSLERYIV
ncbi:MAG: branched-chain amino acid ABC transporter permease [Syntrophobacterales bacterium]|nr:MAG: branched-chain amino acid ABC transporter permease [Syntrophobacterales bacterium]